MLGYNHLTDAEFMEHAFKGDADAIRFVLDMVSIAGAWDDLIDRDKPVSGKDIDNVFWLALGGVPANPFYLKHQAELQPVMRMGILNWWLANEMQKTPGRSREIAHVLRYSIADVATCAAYLIGGHAWAREVGPELRLRGQKDDMANFMKECKRA